MKYPNEFRILNNFLDKVVSPDIFFLGKFWNAYLFWQYVGIIWGILAIFALTLLLDLSFFVIFPIVTIAVLIAILSLKRIVVFSKSLKQVTIFGKPLAPALIWIWGGIYPVQIISIVTISLFLWIVGQPVLDYLDVLVVGLMVAQLFGRFGCFSVGCCHGRPHSWGGRYGNQHKKAGYLNHLQGVRLFPIQLTESLWLLFLILVSGIILLGGHISGAVFAWYILGYGIGRFFFEFFRGDVDRRYFWVFSEAQWVALILVTTILSLELLNILEFFPWHFWISLVLFVAAIWIGFIKLLGKSERLDLLQPNHFKGFIASVSWLYGLLKTGIPIAEHSSLQGNPFRAETSLNVVLSATGTNCPSDYLYRYRISYQNSVMNKKTGRMLADLILKLRYPSDPYRIDEVEQGVFDLFIGQCENELEETDSVGEVRS